MEAASRKENRERARVLHNFFQNQPRLFSRIILGDCNGEEETLRNEFKRIRNKAICSLIVKHGLSHDQVKVITLNDVDLAGKRVAIKSGDDFTPYSLLIDERTAENLATYLRVRSPTNETELFPLEPGVERFEGLNCV